MSVNKQAIIYPRASDYHVDRKYSLNLCESIRSRDKEPYDNKMIFTEFGSSKIKKYVGWHENAVNSVEDKVAELIALELLK